MELSNCLLCLKECFPGESIKKTEEILSRYTDDSTDPVHTKLDIIFLLKKKLEIPENVFSEVSQKLGDPNLWIDCCESCSLIVENVNQIWKEMMLLEEQFTKLQYKITGKIKRSEHSSDDSFQFYFNSEANTTVRSYVCQAFGDAIKVSLEDVKVESIENSPDHILVCETIVLPPPDLSYIDCGYEEEELAHQTDNKSDLNLNAEIEHPVEFFEIDNGDKNLYVRTSGFKEEEQIRYSAECEEKRIIDPLGIMSSKSETKCFKENIKALKAFKCVKCSETFTTESELLDHKQFLCGMRDTIEEPNCSLLTDEMDAADPLAPGTSLSVPIPLKNSRSATCSLLSHQCRYCNLHSCDRRVRHRCEQRCSGPYFCSRQFALPDNLNRHLRKDHPV